MAFPHTNQVHDFGRYLNTLETLKACVESNPRIINAKDKRGHTLLAEACIMERLDLVRFLLSVGSNPNSTVLWRYGHQTCLMIACYRGYKDIAQILIENGANVNTHCEIYQRTALHYVCMDEYKSENNHLVRRSQCIQLLLEHGAEYQEDSSGMTPMCYAALSRMDEELLVTFQGNNDFVLSKMENIKFRILRGVSYAIWDRTEIIDHAFDSFLEAKQLELKYGHLPESSLSKSLSACLGREECKTVTELEKLKGNRDALVIEGFLAGQRIIPNRIAPEYLWQHMLDYVNDKLCEGVDSSLCQRIVRFIIELHLSRHTGLHRAGLLKNLSKFCEGADFALCKSTVHCMFSPWLAMDTRLRPVFALSGLSTAMRKAGGVVDSASFMGFLLETISNCIETLNLEQYEWLWIDNVCESACYLSFYQGEDMLHSVLPQLDDIVRKIYRRLNIDTRQQHYKVCATIRFFWAIQHAAKRVAYDLPRTVKTNENLKRVISTFLHLDNAAYTLRDGKTVLHLIARKMAFDYTDRGGV